MKKNILLIVLGIIIGASIGAFAINANEITYGNTTVDQAINTLYTTQNTTVANLTSENNTLTSQNTSLTNQVSSLQATINNMNKHVESGEENITFTHAWQSRTITFDEPFDTIPKIYYKSNSNSNGGTVSAYDITTTGFTIAWIMLPSDFLLPNDTIYWIAVEE